MPAIDDLFDQIEDQPIPGGCDSCDAYQTVEAVVPGVHKLTVHHDEGCPVLRAMKAGAS
jgi:hypothetical protein